MPYIKSYYAQWYFRYLISVLLMPNSVSHGISITLWFCAFFRWFRSCHIVVHNDVMYLLYILIRQIEQFINLQAKMAHTTPWVIGRMKYRYAGYTHMRCVEKLTAFQWHSHQIVLIHRTTYSEQLSIDTNVVCMKAHTTGNTVNSNRRLFKYTQKMIIHRVELHLYAVIKSPRRQHACSSRNHE